jgi:hypothetical protein
MGRMEHGLNLVLGNGEKSAEELASTLQRIGREEE